MLKLRGTFEFCLSDSLNKLLDILEKNASRSGEVQRNRSMRQTHVFRIDLRGITHTNPCLSQNRCWINRTYENTAANLQSAHNPAVLNMNRLNFFSSKNTSSLYHITKSSGLPCYNFSYKKRLPQDLFLESALYSGKEKLQVFFSDKKASYNKTQTDARASKGNLGKA